MRFMEWKGNTEGEHMKHKNCGGFHSPFHKKKQTKEENESKTVEEGQSSEIKQEPQSQPTQQQGKKKKK